MAIIISADEIKKQLPDYTPDRAEFFHKDSAKMADKLFLPALKDDKHKQVILLNGGTASGKTEFLMTQLLRKRCIVFDATMTTEQFAVNKIRQIREKGKKPIIYAVIPDNLKRAFIAFLSRDRKFSDSHFYRTHSGSRKTLLWIATNHPEVEINIVESSYTNSQKMQFAQLKFDSKQQQIDYLTGLQLTEDGIIKSINLLE